MPATKSNNPAIAPSRRGILAMLGGLALASLATPAAARASDSPDNLVIRGGWILRPDDLVRLGLE
jgi:hypothetical protein